MTPFLHFFSPDGVYASDFPTMGFGGGTQSSYNYFDSNSTSTSVNSSQVRMIDREDSFSPSDWSDQPLNVQWRLTNNGRNVSGGSVSVTPREAYHQSDEVGFATAAGTAPSQQVTYDFVTYTQNGFTYSGWSVTATAIDPWGIQNRALQHRVDLQNQGVIPGGVDLGAGGGISTFLYNQLPASIQYNGYYYAIPSSQ